MDDQPAAGDFDIGAVDVAAAVFDSDVVQLGDARAVQDQAYPTAGGFGLPGKGDRLAGGAKRGQSAADIQPPARGEFQRVARIDRQHVTLAGMHGGIDDVRDAGGRPALLSVNGGRSLYKNGVGAVPAGRQTGQQ
jgi:hypothetical protein